MRQQRRRFLATVIVLAMMLAVVPIVWAEGADKININKASVEELAQLKKVGQKYAQRIVEYRENHGPFGKPDDITKVRGIGPQTFELNKDRIVVK